MQDSHICCTLVDQPDHGLDVKPLMNTQCLFVNTRSSWGIYFCCYSCSCAFI